MSRVDAQHRAMGLVRIREHAVAYLHGVRRLRQQRLLVLAHLYLYLYGLRRLGQQRVTHRSLLYCTSLLHWVFLAECADRPR